jgi:hypothetical protein
MRRVFPRALALTCTLGLVAAPLLAAPSHRAPGRPAPAQTQIEPVPSGPPQAWLFGAWTGGLFPPPSHLTAESCLAQPSVIFTRDVVMRSTLTEITFVQRIVETARTSGGHVEFRFTPEQNQAQSGSLLGVASDQPPPGFGCESPDVLHVQRKGENEITFPGCADFPNPLVRCPGR